MPRHALLAPLALALLLAGCVVDARPPARSEPLESIAPLPDAVGPGRLAVVAYALDEVVVAAPFDAAWDAAAGEAALAEMGFERLNGTAFRQEGGGRNVTLRVEPRDGGGFWLNATYDGFDVEAPTLPEAHAAADEAWAALEPVYVATLAGFEGRTGWTAVEPAERTNVFTARLDVVDG